MARVVSLPPGLMAVLIGRSPLAPHAAALNVAAAQLAPRYPHWQDFLRVRAQLDPQGVFLNDYLRRLFGVDTTQAAPVSVAEDTTAD